MDVPTLTKCLPNHSWKSPQDLSIKSVIHKIENAVRLKKQIIIAFSLFFVANLSAQSSKNILINEFLASNVSVDADVVNCIFANITKSAVYADK